MKKNTTLLYFTHGSLFCAAVMATLFLASCKKIDVYEKNVSIANYQWQYKLQPTFNFTIIDTASLYTIYVVLRHTDGYRYNNIWLNVTTQLPGDTLRQQKFDMQLGTDANGWEGTGMDDIWEIRKPLTKGPIRLTKPGSYSFSVAQIMREDPLPNIMSVGIRVERVN